MTSFEELELLPLVGAAFDTRESGEHRGHVEAIEQWWRDRPFRPWHSRTAQEQRALRTAARVDALARLMRETRP